MATNFPTSLDNLGNPAGSAPVNNPSHAAQHADVNDAIEALENKVGVNNSTVTTSLEYRVKNLETNPVVSYTDENARNAIGTALIGSGGITVTPNDSANTITVSTNNTIATKTYVDTAISGLASTSAETYVLDSLVGNPEGIATLDINSRVPLSQLGNLIDGAPLALDTLNELAAAINDDASYAATITTALGNKVSKAGGDVITSSLPGVIGLTVKGAASQTADLVSIQKSSGFALARFDANANIILGSTAVDSNNYLSFIKAGGAVGGYAGIRFGNDVNGTNQHTLTINTASPDLTLEHKDVNSKFIVKGAASQIANLQEWQNSGGTALAWFTSNGTLNVRYARATTNDSTVIPLISKGAASQTADLQQWQNSAGTVLSYVRNDGLIYSPYLQGNRIFAYAINSDWANYSMTSTAPSAAIVPLGIRGAASQTANLQEWQNSAGTVLAKVDAAGKITAAAGQGFAGQYLTGLSLGAGSYIELGSGSLVLNTRSATNSILVRGAASQTANLQEWQNSAGTDLSKIDASGAMFTITAPANTNTTQVATTAYVQTELADLVNSAPATLDTLKELSDALGADANFATTVTNNLALKAPLASPTLTGTPTAPTAAVGTDTTQIATTAFVIDQIDASTQPGALYQTTAPANPEVGQIWIDSDDDVTVFDSNIVRRQPFTATAGQTNFVTTAPFIDGFEQVYFNGLLLLKTTDYTTSGNNTVILGSAAAVGDIIEVVTITNLNSVNTYTQAETNALLAANTSVAPLSVSANTSLLAKKRYFVTSASALTLTLPASPTLNDEIQILDASGNASTYNITVARNGNLINGNAGNLIIDNNGGWYTLLYTGATYGWKVG